MKAKSIKGKSTEEVQSALTKSMADGFRPTLAICFISKNLDRKAISALLDAEGISIFGCTTNGEFIDEQTENGTVAILLMDMKRDHFKIYLEEYPQKNHREIASGIAKKAKVPIVPVSFDYGNKKVVVHPIFNTTADEKKDFEFLEQLFKGVEGYALDKSY